MGHSATQQDTTVLRDKHDKPIAPKRELAFPLALFPENVQAYLEIIRLEKPAGTILLFWPFAWGLTMAAYRTKLDLASYTNDLFRSAFAAFILRSSACTINDIFDRKIDAGVARSKTRPLPSGRISLPGAIFYLFAQYATGVAFFASYLEGLAFHVSVFQLLPLFIAYPLMKRITHWPQAWLGFAMNFGYITAWVGVTGYFDVPILSAALVGTWCWTMMYDTIYACQDIVDDRKTGVKSTAILFGDWIRPILIALGVVFNIAIAVAGYYNNQQWPFYVVAVGGLFLDLLYQYYTVDLETPKSCWDNFNHNGNMGWIVWAGLMVDYAYALSA